MYLSSSCRVCPQLLIPTLLPARVKPIPLGFSPLWPTKPKRKILSSASFLLTYLVLEKVSSSPGLPLNTRNLNKQCDNPCSEMSRAPLGFPAPVGG